VQYEVDCWPDGRESYAKWSMIIRDVKNPGDYFIDSVVCGGHQYWNSMDRIQFENSSITELPDGVIHPALSSISVSFVGLLRIKPEDFSNGQNLRELDLSHNNLKVLEDKLFSNLTKLIELDLSYNEIIFIHPEAFKNCCKFLTVLELQHNKIMELTISENVKFLNVANNKINQDSDLFHMENLVKLDLSNNFLGPLNISTFSKLTKLEVLNLKGTNISDIQFGTFSHQHSLKVLNISDNSLGQLDLHWFLALDKLEEFYFSGNKLRKIENLSQIKTIFSWLHEISISNNDFDCSYLVLIVKVMRLSKIKLVNSEAPIVHHESNVKGIRCIGNVPTEPESPIEDTKVLAGNDTSINDLREMLDYRFGKLENSSKIEGTSNYFLEFLVGAAAFMIIIYTTVKLIDYFKFKSFFQRTRLFKLSSLSTIQTDT
jgi:Leucine-rich repeat (LRR) protein